MRACDKSNSRKYLRSYQVEDVINKRTLTVQKVNVLLFDRYDGFHIIYLNIG